MWAATSRSLNTALTPTAMLGANTTGMRCATSAMRAFSATENPAVPITTALPISQARPASSPTSRPMKGVPGWSKAAARAIPSSFKAASISMRPMRPEAPAMATRIVLIFLTPQKSAAQFLRRGPMDRRPPLPRPPTGPPALLLLRRRNRHVRRAQINDSGRGRHRKLGRRTGDHVALHVIELVVHEEHRDTPLHHGPLAGFEAIDVIPSVSVEDIRQ